jgi:RNA polymerase sigma-70 factor (ECF subfamily)
MAQNLAIDSFRKQKRATILSFDQDFNQMHESENHENELIDTSTNLAEKIEFQEIQDFIEKALIELPEEQRNAFLFSQIQGMHYQEIAQIQNCPVGTVKSRVHQALTKIRAVLKANDLL